MKVRKAGKKLAQREDNQSAFDDLPIEVALAAAAFQAPAKRERDCYANYEQEKRKDEICWSPAVPFGVLQRPIDTAPVARIVHENHAGDHDAAKHIQRHEA